MKPIALRPAEQDVLQNLERLTYATRHQLEYWTTYSQPTLSLAFTALRDMGFVGCEKGGVPNVWSLKRWIIKKGLNAHFSYVPPIWAS